MNHTKQSAPCTGPTPVGVGLMPNNGKPSERGVPHVLCLLMDHQFDRVAQSAIN